MKFLSAGLFLGLLALPVAAPSAIIFGNLDISQTGGGGSDVTLALSYSSSAAMTVGYNSTRGDFVVDFDPAADSDRVRGILISSASQLFRDNSALGDSPAGVNYATASIATTTSNRYFIPTTVTSGSALDAGDEININVAAAYFSYADGWIGGHVRSANATVTATDPLDTLIGSSGLVLTSTTPSAGDTNYIYDDPATNGVYQIKLSNALGVINSVTDGLLLVVGGDNVGRYALSRTNADGTWTVIVRANDANGSTKVNGEFGFVYVPKTSVVSTGTGIYALGRVNANMTRDIEGGNFILVHSSEGTYTLYAPGLNPLTSTLMLSPEASTGGEDNIWMYGTFGKGWRIQTRDLPEALLQELTGDIDLFSFALMSDRTTLTNWTNQGSGTSWDTAANWANSTLPTSGNDVIFSTLSGSSSVSLATAKTVGMLTITSNTGFDITGSALLTVDTGIAVNATPTSAQNYTVSTPIQFSADAFIIAQSLSTNPVNLVFNNTLSANNKNLLFTGGTQNDVASVTNVSKIDVNGVINLG
ncbi:MAG TPA: hypothetical protein VK956_10585, partial [Verrucomicrobium sp.]|nr:hypothetical protein [Verrucomicrobium sp.]